MYIYIYMARFIYRPGHTSSIPLHSHAWATNFLRDQACFLRDQCGAWWVFSPKVNDFDCFVQQMGNFVCGSCVVWFGGASSLNNLSPNMWQAPLRQDIYIYIFIYYVEMYVFIHVHWYVTYTMTHVSIHTHTHMST